MGFFSWKTSDTKKTIWNNHTDKCKTVYLYCPDGTIIKEEQYEGYGVFGGKDAYALLAEWNTPEKCTGDTERDRLIGIDLEHGEEPLKFPLKLSFSINRKYQDLPPAMRDERQGFFD